MQATHTVVNEVIYLRVVDGRLHFRVERLDLPSGGTPDGQLRAVLGWDHEEPAGALLHSTSWRAEAEHDRIVLTWAVVPDPVSDRAAFPVGEPIIAQGSDGAHPVPEHVQIGHVVAHAARHLAFLSHTDAAVERAIHRHSRLHDALIAFAPDVAVNAGHRDH